jgi:hypothetical protein
VEFSSPAELEKDFPSPIQANHGTHANNKDKHSRLDPASWRANMMLAESIDRIVFIKMNLESFDLT